MKSFIIALLLTVGASAEDYDSSLYACDAYADWTKTEEPINTSADPEDCKTACDTYIDETLGPDNDVCCLHIESYGNNYCYTYSQQAAEGDIRTDAVDG